MRLAEIVMAIVMAAFSLYLMWKSAELDIGWIPEEGPGGGAFPFWLAAIMLLSCGAIIVRWLRRTSPLSVSTESYMDSRARKLFAVVAGSLTVMIGMIHVIGTYFSVLLFLIFYMRFMGRHPWGQTLAVSVGSMIFIFLFFDIFLRIVMPKGYAEPLFLPLYELFF